MAGFSAIAFVLLIFLFLLREGVPAFFEVPLGNLFGTRWYPTFDLYGALPLILGSLLVTVTAIVIALRWAWRPRCSCARSRPTGRARFSSR